MWMRKKLLTLLLAMTLVLQMCLVGASANGGSVDFTASAPDANGVFTVTMTVRNVSFNAFQFALNYNGNAIVPVEPNGTAAEEFDYFAEPADGTSRWMSTIGTVLDTENELITFTGYVTPGGRGSYITDGNVVAPDSGVALFNFYFKVVGDGDPGLSLATSSTGLPYDKSLPEGGGLADAGYAQEARVTFDLTALAAVEDKTETEIGNESTKPSEGEEDERPEAPADGVTAEYLLEHSIILQLNNRIAVVENGVTAIYPGETEVCAYLNAEQRTMVPVRFVAERLGAEVGWEDSTRTVIIEMNGNVIRMPIGKSVYTLNGVEKTMDTAAVIEHNRTMVPIRFVAEALGYEVGYHHPTRMITISPMKWDMDSTTAQEALMSANGLMLLYGMFV